MDEYLRLAPFPEVSAALERLQMKRAILSNGSPDLLDPLVRNSGLRFDAVLSGDELKIYKPAPQVYALAGRRLGIPQERPRFISSNCWDAAAAKAHGLPAYGTHR